MLGFIIVLVVAIIGSAVYLLVRGGAEAAHVDLDDAPATGPEVPETEAAAEHRARMTGDRRRRQR